LLRKFHEWRAGRERTDDSSGGDPRGGGPAGPGSFV
jgi:hypothetical protein